MSSGSSLSSRPPQIARARVPGHSAPVTGVLGEDGLRLLDQGLADLLAGGVDVVRRAVADAASQDPVDSYDLLAPVEGLTEVWAAGVTYERSRAARVAESEREADVYERVYDATRPELFFKSTAWRVVGPGAPISVRADSVVDVPEPELAVVLDAAAQVVGFTVCNDVSSRTIEGENPLYLPQAKVYLGGCALGPAITPVWELADPLDVAISMTIERGGAVVWEGEASTSQLRRSLEELVEHLFRADVFPQGVVLATGTCLVPDLPFTLRADDVVAITLAGIGTLANPVVEGLPPR